MKNLVPKDLKTTELLEEINGQAKEIILELDFYEGEISVYNQIPTNSTPGRIWNGLAVQRSLPLCVDASQLYDFVESDIIPIAEKIKQIFAVIYDGGMNRRGHYGDDENDLFYELEKAIEGCPQHNGGLYDIRDWATITKKELITYTDEQLKNIIENEAYADDVVLYGPDTLDYVQEIRAEESEKC